VQYKVKVYYGQPEPVEFTATSKPTFETSNIIKFETAQGEVLASGTFTVETLPAA
jgi:hypothetical protein